MNYAPDGNANAMARVLIVNAEHHIREEPVLMCIAWLICGRFLETDVEARTEMQLK